MRAGSCLRAPDEVAGAQLCSRQGGSRGCGSALGHEGHAGAVPSPGSCSDALPHLFELGYAAAAAWLVCSEGTTSKAQRRN
jgi:hypothetical protein